MNKQPFVNRILFIEREEDDIEVVILQYGKEFVREDVEELV